jgi:hypothetical protein
MQFSEREMALFGYVRAIFDKYKYVYNVLFRTINIFIL